MPEITETPLQAFANRNALSVRETWRFIKWMGVSCMSLVGDDAEYFLEYMFSIWKRGCYGASAHQQ